MQGEGPGECNEARDAGGVASGQAERWRGGAVESLEQRGHGVELGVSSFPRAGNEFCLANSSATGFGPTQNWNPKAKPTRGNVSFAARALKCEDSESQMYAIGTWWRN